MPRLPTDLRRVQPLIAMPVLMAVAVAGCSTSRFYLGADALAQAEERAISREASGLASEGLSGAWIRSEWRGAWCVRTPEAHDKANCPTSYRHAHSPMPWKPITVKVRRDEDGNWEMSS